MGDVMRSAFERIARFWRTRFTLLIVVLAGLGTLTHIGFSAGSRSLAAHIPTEALNYIQVQDIHIVGRIYSNVAGIVWFWDRTAATWRTYGNIPHKMGWDEIEAGAYVVWFDRFHYLTHRSYDYLDLRLMPGIEIVAELADGVVFRRTASEPFDAERHRARKQRYVNQLIQQASEHVVRAGWSVYRTGRRLVYRKEPCAPADVQAKFVLHVFPADPADLPADRQQYGSENLDFYFDSHSHFGAGSQRKSLGFRLGDQCMAIAQLPDYAIDRIYIGQWISAEDRTLWEAEFSASR